MSILPSRFYQQISTIGGGLSVTTSPMRGILRHIIVRAATSSTTFDLSISDGSSLALFERESGVGEINETVTILVDSLLQVTVSGATRDELFKVYLAVQET